MSVFYCDGFKEPSCLHAVNCVCVQLSESLHHGGSCSAAAAAAGHR